MGFTAYSDALYTAKAELRAKTNTPTFAHDADVSAKAAAGDHDAYRAHKSLDPKGIGIRECRDSAQHPNSLAIATWLDVTGSMSEVPRIAQKSLPKLMGLLLRRALVADPAILTGAVGDATCDRVPLQIGQFESGIEIENDLTNLILEGAGGGQTTESYEIPMWLMRHRTAMDCWEKRGQKGYMFIVGDEQPYPAVKAKELERLTGIKLQGDVPLEQVVEELKERWEVFFLMPKMTQHFGDERILKIWRKLFGQNVILLEDPNGIAACIATQIGVCEGKIDPDAVVDAVVEVGTDRNTAEAVGRALVRTASTRPTGTDLQLPADGADAPSGLATL